MSKQIELSEVLPNKGKKVHDLTALTADERNKHDFSKYAPGDKIILSVEGFERIVVEVPTGRQILDAMSAGATNNVPFPLVFASMCVEFDGKKYAAEELADELPAKYTMQAMVFATPFMI